MRSSAREVRAHGRVIKRVVVPLDGSDLAARAIEPARMLADATGATLRLMTAEPLVPWHEEIERASEYIEQQAAATGLTSVETIVVHDRAARQAIFAEGQVQDTVVCMAAHGRSGVGYATLGSVTEAVVRESTQPLLLVGPELVIPGSPFRNADLIVPVDGSAASESIVPIAADWAQMLHLRPRVVAALHRDHGADESSAAQVVERVAHTLQQAGASPTSEVLGGPDAATAIVDYATTGPAALVAMATHGRTGLARVALGSVTMRVVHQSRCPVLVARSPHLGE